MIRLLPALLLTCTLAGCLRAPSRPVDPRVGTADVAVRWDPAGWQVASSGGTVTLPVTLHNVSPGGAAVRVEAWRVSVDAGDGRLCLGSGTTDVELPPEGTARIELRAVCPSAQRPTRPAVLVEGVLHYALDGVAREVLVSDRVAVAPPPELPA